MPLPSLRHINHSSASTTAADSASSGIRAHSASALAAATGDTERHEPGNSAGKSAGKSGGTPCRPARLRVKNIAQPDTSEHRHPSPCSRRECRVRAHSLKRSSGTCEPGTRAS